MIHSDFPHFPLHFLASLTFDLDAFSCLHPLPQMKEPMSEALHPGEVFRHQLPMPLLGAGKGKGQPSLE